MCVMENGLVVSVQAAPPWYENGLPQRRSSLCSTEWVAATEQRGGRSQGGFYGTGNFYRQLLLLSNPV